MRSSNYAVSGGLWPTATASCCSCPVAGPGMFIVLSGQVGSASATASAGASRWSSRGRDSSWRKPGQLSGRPALVDGVAEGSVETILIPPWGWGRCSGRGRSRRADGRGTDPAPGTSRPATAAAGRRRPGGRRRAEAGDLSQAEWLSTQGRRSRDRFAAAGLLGRCRAGAAGLPPGSDARGAVLHNPWMPRTQRSLGLLGAAGRAARFFDVAVVGAGPAGALGRVSTPRRRGCRWCSTRRATGGPAGASARIGNALGFPTGIAGQALTGQALVQAEKFGAEIISRCGRTHLPRPRARPLNSPGQAALAAEPS